ncbi:MAG: TolC family protein [Bacteroidetes bacterium]|nr:MAG: TolC family protein [Bacteroidota bacterium]
MKRFSSVSSFVLLSFACITDGYGQFEMRHLALQDAIEIAKDQSPDALNSKQTFRASFWEYKSFKASRLPLLDLDATLPQFQRKISQQTDITTGQQVFVPQQYFSSDANLSLSQQIGFTGGSIFIRSGLEAVYNITDSNTISSFLSTPVNVGLTQPIFQYNPFKWDRKIQPMKYSQAKQKYLEDVEQISIATTNYFFNLLSAQIELKIAYTNLSNYDTLYRIAQGRYQLGKIAENDLLLLELNFLKAQAAVENAELALDNALFRFKSFLRIKDTIPIELIPPSDIRFFNVNPNQAVILSQDNSSAFMDFQKRLLEAARDVNRAKLEGRFDAELTAVVGLTKNANTLAGAYQNPLDQQQLALGLNIPLYDWGVARGRIKMAESQEEIVKNSVEQEMIDFERNVYLKVVQFNMQKNQVTIAAKSDTVARKNYEVTKGRYLIGKMNSILDLNNAQIETDNAEKAYYQALETYWRNYFELRKLTLFDFRNNRPLQFNLDDISL